ncbi:MAG: putative metal-dependent hydrolase with the TIM-barrel fold [Bacteroidetes bacterium HLUCCA01]|nr:MAG: putative metal-dependent hydrolase with the TIM-barrel fold [Bacteroidetes bacterium HLUCCA01]
MRVFVVILAAALVAAAACNRASDTLVIHNVNGYTLSSADGSLLTFEAMAIRDGKILEIGSDDGIVLAYPLAEKRDGEGRTVLPGLTDAHAHVVRLGESLLMVNLMGTQSLDEALERIQSYAGQYPDLPWVVGRGWNQVLWEQDFPTAADLDRIIPDRPVYLTRVDGHAAWVNTAALQAGGITAETPDPTGGAILRDQNGEATGILIDRAMYPVRSLIPEPTEDEQRLALELALEEMRTVGLTGAHDAGTSVAHYRMYKEFADNGTLTARIYAMISGSGEVFDELAADGPVIGYADDLLHMRSVKIYSDGALGSRGAALLEDYSDDPGNRGLLFYTEDEFTSMIEKVSTRGFQAGVHAIGDRGNRIILNAFERVRDQYGDQGLRHRIEHSQVVSPPDIPRFAELDIIPSMQPTHATSDMNMAEDRLGLIRILGAYAWRTFLDQGSVIAAGSDFPVELSNPFHGLYSAVTRTDQRGNPEGGWYPRQSLTREEALHGFTIGAAYAGHLEHVTGTLESGKWADFIVLDRDYFTIPESEIWQIQVLETWVGGRKVFDRDE